MPVASSFPRVTGVSGAAERGSLECVSSSVNAQYPKGISARLKGSTWRRLLTDLENLNWQGKQMTITMLMMLIKHCVSDHCNGIANKDLSVNEKYNLIMDKGEESSSLSSVRGGFAHALQRFHQHFLSPWRLLTLIPELRFMITRSIYCFPLSLLTCSDMIIRGMMQ